MNERLSLQHSTAQPLIISLGVWPASRDARDGYGCIQEGVLCKEKFADLTGMDTSTMVYDFGRTDGRLRPVKLFCFEYEGWHGVYDRWIIMPSSY